MNETRGSPTVERLRARFVLTDEDVYALVEEFMADPLTDEWDPDCFFEWFREEVQGELEPSEKRVWRIMQKHGWTEERKQVDSS